MIRLQKYFGRWETNLWRRCLVNRSRRLAADRRTICIDIWENWSNYLRNGIQNWLPMTCSLGWSSIDIPLHPEVDSDDLVVRQWQQIDIDSKLWSKRWRERNLRNRDCFISMQMRQVFWLGFYLYSLSNACFGLPVVVYQIFFSGTVRK